MKENNDYRYYITNDNYAEIIQFKASTSTLRNVVLDEIDGYPIKRVCNNAFDNSPIQTLVVGKDVEYIGASAFYNCNSLTKVTYEEGSQLKSVGSNAFAFSEALEYVHFPRTLESVGSSCFDECSNLYVLFEALSTGNISFGNYWSGYTSYEIIGSYSNVKEVKENNDYRYYITNDNYVGIIEFFNTESTSGLKLDTIDSLPIKIICKKAFQNSKISSVDFGGDVTSIDSYAFSGCQNLKYVNFEENAKLETIGSYAFYECKQLRFIFIPKTVTSIGSYCFQYDTKCYVLFEILNTSDISFGTKWNGYNLNLIITQVSYSVFTCVTNVKSASYNNGTLRYSTYDGSNATIAW